MFARAAKLRGSTTPASDMIQFQPNASDIQTYFNSSVESVTQYKEIIQRQHYNTMSQRLTATKWMIDKFSVHGKKNFISKCVKRFPSFFPGNVKSNRLKSSDCWKKRRATMNLKTDKTRRVNFTFHGTLWVQRENLKYFSGGGVRLIKWVAALHIDTREEFKHLRSDVVKFTNQFLLVKEKNLINRASPDSSYNMRHKNVYLFILDCLPYRCIQFFMVSNLIMKSAQTGKLLVSVSKQEHIEKLVAYHLGQVRRGFKSVGLNVLFVGNADETHFVLNL